MAGNGRKVNLTSIGSERELVSNRENTEAQLRATAVPVRTQLPEFRLSMRDIANLKTGTVLATGIATDAPLLTFIGTTPRFHSTAGWVGRKLAVRILDTIDASVAGAHTKPSE